MAWCVKCRKRVTRRSLVAGYCVDCRQSPDLRTQRELSLLQSTALTETQKARTDRLNALGWSDRVVRGFAWGALNALGIVLVVSLLIFWFLTPQRGVLRNSSRVPPPLPHWPGWLWFGLWCVLTLSAVAPAYGILGPWGAVSALVMATCLAGGIHGGYRAAKRDWSWCTVLKDDD